VLCSKVLDETSRETMLTRCREQAMQPTMAESMYELMSIQVSVRDEQALEATIRSSLAQEIAADCNDHETCILSVLSLPTTFFERPL
jgi:hypothetical protein